MKAKTYEELYTDEVVEELAAIGQPVPSKEDLTCSRCDCVGECQYAWDLYNTQGDCLADK